METIAIVEGSAMIARPVVMIAAPLSRSYLPAIRNSVLTGAALAGRGYHPLVMPARIAAWHERFPQSASIWLWVYLSHLPRCNAVLLDGSVGWAFEDPIRTVATALGVPVFSSPSQLMLKVHGRERPHPSPMTEEQILRQLRDPQGEDAAAQSGEAFAPPIGLRKENTEIANRFLKEHRRAPMQSVLIVGPKLPDFGRTSLCAHAAATMLIGRCVVTVQHYSQCLHSFLPECEEFAHSVLGGDLRLADVVLPVPGEYPFVTRVVQLVEKLKKERGSLRPLAQRPRPGTMLVETKGAEALVDSTQFRDLERHLTVM